MLIFERSNIFSNLSDLYKNLIDRVLNYGLVSVQKRGSLHQVFNINFGTILNPIGPEFDNITIVNRFTNYKKVLNELELLKNNKRDILKYWPQWQNDVKMLKFYCEGWSKIWKYVKAKKITNSKNQLFNFNEKCCLSSINLNIINEILYIQFNQRSCDLSLGFASDIYQYYIFACKIIREYNLLGGYLYVNIQNLHIYSNNIDAMQDWLDAYQNKTDKK